LEKFGGTGEEEIAAEIAREICPSVETGHMPHSDKNMEGTVSTNDYCM
jgi:hypothetical protein